MYPRYYALRRVNPYRGVVQHVDIGDAGAHTYDGVTWHLRADDGHGWTRPVGVWEEGAGLKLGQPGGLGDLIAALETRPALPFPILDTCELWLLDRESGQPLALIDAQVGGPLPADRIDPEWQPFVLTYTAFRSEALTRRDDIAFQASDSHRDFLARQVNQAARPHPMAQWFTRGQDGIGHARPQSLRIPHEWRERELPAAAFPELLVRENWNTRLECSVINDYHRWLAPLLLSWPRLSPETRARLELQACERPAWLARVHRLLPASLQPERIRAALVAARLEEAAGAGNDWISP